MRTPPLIVALGVVPPRGPRLDDTSHLPGPLALAALGRPNNSLKPWKATRTFG